MGEKGAGHPAARAIVPSAHPSESEISMAKLTARRTADVPIADPRPVQGDWGQLATAPTLLLTTIEPADIEDAVATSRIAVPPATALEEQPWFKTGTTVAPPSMRPMGASLTPPPLRKSPNPRVLKVVAGVIAACLFIVAAAGFKLLYKHFHAPAAPAPTAESTSRTVMASVNVAHTPPTAPESARPAELAPVAPPSAAAGVAPIVSAPQADSTRRTTPARSNPSPARAATKATKRRTPTPKKTGRGTH